MSHAISCPVRLYSYRKGRTGTIISFEVDPADIPARLQLDPLGTPYMMALAEIDVETGERKEGEATERGNHIGRATSARNETAPGSPIPPGRARNPLAQQAGRLCKDISFQRFMDEFTGAKINSDESCTHALRDYLGIQTRADIMEGTPIGDQWLELVGTYRAWQMAPVAGVDNETQDS